MGLWMVLAFLESVGMWPYASFTAIAFHSSGSPMFLGSGGGVWIMEGEGNFWRRIGEIRAVGGVVRDLRYYADTSRKLLLLTSSFQIWDVTEPATPELLARVELPEEGLRMDVEDSLAFLALGEVGMQVMAVSGPSPAVVGHYDPGDAVVDLDVQDSLAVLLVGSTLPIGTFHFVDVSDPVQPTLIVTWPSEDVFWSVSDFVLKDTFLLVLADENLFVLSVADPSSPVLLNTVPLRYATHLALTENLAYAVGGGRGWIEMWAAIWILDLSNLPSITVVDSLVGSFPLIPRRMEGIAGRAFILDVSGDLVVLEGTQSVGSLGAPGQGTLDVVSYGSRGFLASGRKGILLMDFSDPGWPVMVRRWFDSYGGNVYDFSAYKRWLFAIISWFDPDMGFLTRLVALDTADSVSRHGWSFDPGSPYLQGYAIDGDSLYVLLRGDSLLLFEVGGSFPLRAEAVLPYSGRDIVVRGSLAVVSAGTTGVGLLDIRDIGNPQLLSVINTPGEARVCALLGDVLYIADGSGGLQVYSLAYPQVPVKVAHLPLQADGVDIVAPYGVVWSREGNLYLLDLTQPVHPLVMDGYRVSGKVLRARLHPPYIYLAKGAQGLEILRFSETGVLESRARVWLIRRENRLPSRAFYDVLGRSVRPSSFLPPGVYFFRGEDVPTFGRVYILP